MKKHDIMLCIVDEDSGAIVSDIVLGLWDGTEILASENNGYVYFDDIPVGVHRIYTMCDVFRISVKCSGTGKIWKKGFSYPQKYGTILGEMTSYAVGTSVISSIFKQPDVGKAWENYKRDQLKLCPGN